MKLLSTLSLIGNAAYKMLDNIRALLVDVCDIQRPQVNVSAGTIQDRQVTQYNTVTAAVPCWFEVQSVSYDYNHLMGQQPTRRGSVYFVGGTGVKEGDRLAKSDGTYWLVDGVINYSSQGMHIHCTTYQLNYSKGQL